MFSALDGFERSGSRHKRFIPGKISHDTHRIGGCMGLRVDIDAVERRTVSCPWAESNAGRPLRSQVTANAELSGSSLQKYDDDNNNSNNNNNNIEQTFGSPD
jgi:hypothetical protein